MKTYLTSDEMFKVDLRSDKQFLESQLTKFRELLSMYDLAHPNRDNLKKTICQYEDKLRVKGFEIDKEIFYSCVEGLQHKARNNSAVRIYADSRSPTELRRSILLGLVDNRGREECLTILLEVRNENIILKCSTPEGVKYQVLSEIDHGEELDHICNFAYSSLEELSAVSKTHQRFVQQGKLCLEEVARSAHQSR